MRHVGEVFGLKGEGWVKAARIRLDSALTRRSLRSRRPLPEGEAITLLPVGAVLRLIDEDTDNADNRHYYKNQQSSFY
jgi:hypothetical protein